MRNKRTKRLAIALLTAALAGCGGDTATPTPRQDAAMTGDQAKLEAALATAPAEINNKDSGNNTPLHNAVLSDNRVAIQFLIDHHANLEPVDEDGQTPLSFAADKGKTEAAKLLIAAGANVNTKDQHLRTP